MTLFIEKLIEYGVDIRPTFERFVNDEEFYKSCLEMLLADNNIEELEKSIQNKEVDSAFQAAHALKGVVANLGLPTLYFQVSGLVEKLRANNIENIKDDYQNIVSELEKVKELIS